MTEKDIKNLMDSVDAKLKKGFTREEALQSLQRAGILDKDGNHTPPYQNLGRYLESLRQAQKTESSPPETTPDPPSSAKP